MRELIPPTQRGNSGFTRVYDAYYRTVLVDREQSRAWIWQTVSRETSRVSKQVGRGSLVTQCQGNRSNGERCRARPVRGEDFCFFHHPERVHERSAARRAGGKARSAPVLPADTAEVAIKSAQDVAALLADTINQVRRGELDPRVANTVGYLATVLLKAQDTGALEERLVLLEGLVAHKRRESVFTLEPSDDLLALPCAALEQRL